MSNYYIYNGQVYSEDELRHYGVKGMKWGVRRHHTPDGSLTEAGRKRLVSKQYNRNNDLMKTYIRTINKHGYKSKEAENHRKLLAEQNKRLSQSLRDYLDALPKSKVDDLIKVDYEHGRRYVDARMFDKTVKYDDVIYID